MFATRFIVILVSLGLWFVGLPGVASAAVAGDAPTCAPGSIPVNYPPSISFPDTPGPGSVLAAVPGSYTPCDSPLHPDRMYAWYSEDQYGYNQLVYGPVWNYRQYTVAASDVGHRISVQERVCNTYEGADNCIWTASGKLYIAPLPPACSDGQDNDGDGRADGSDSGCHSDYNDQNGASYNSSDNDEWSTQCSNYRDDDSDGYTDYKPDDSPPTDWWGCSDFSDDNESDDSPAYRDAVQYFDFTTRLFQETSPESPNAATNCWELYAKRHREYIRLVPYPKKIDVWRIDADVIWCYANGIVSKIYKWAPGKYEWGFPYSWVEPITITADCNNQALPPCVAPVAGGASTVGRLRYIVDHCYILQGRTLCSATVDVMIEITMNGDGTYKCVTDRRDDACSKSPTAVTLRSITARRQKRSVLIRWRTSQENDLLGFNVYRLAGERFVRLNPSVIPAAFGGTSNGREYSFLDRSASRIATVHYRLQSVGIDGSRKWVGKVKP